MFESITKGLGDSLGKMQKGRINEVNIREALQEVKQALLEADVSYEVVDSLSHRSRKSRWGSPFSKLSSRVSRSSGLCMRN